MKLRVWVMAGVLACGGVGAVAQTGSDSAVNAGAPMEPAKAQSAMLTILEDEMMGVVKAMPADKFDFAPMSSAIPGSKFDGVRTFAQQAKHVAQANYYFFSTLGGPKPTVNVEAIGSLKTKEEIVQALQGSFAYGHEALATITTANAYQTIKGADGMHTRATVASFAVAHGFDHYGQMVEYLRMNGVVPPGSK